MQIINMKKVEMGPTIKAFFSVDFDKFVIHNFKIMQQQNQRAWVSPPDEKFTDKDGKVKYKKLVDVEKAYLSKIEEMAVAIYNK